MLPCVCSVIDHRGRQNVVRTSVTHSAAPRVPLFCSYHILTSSVIYYWTDARQHGIYLLINFLMPNFGVDIGVDTHGGPVRVEQIALTHARKHTIVRAVITSNTSTADEPLLLLSMRAAKWQTALRKTRVLVGQTRNARAANGFAALILIGCQTTSLGQWKPEGPGGYHFNAKDGANLYLVTL